MGNLDCLDFLQNCFITSTTGHSDDDDVDEKNVSEVF